MAKTLTSQKDICFANLWTESVSPLQILHILSLPRSCQGPSLAWRGVSEEGVFGSSELCHAIPSACSCKTQHKVILGSRTRLCLSSIYWFISVSISLYLHTLHLERSHGRVVQEGRHPTVFEPFHLPASVNLLTVVFVYQDTACGFNKHIKCINFHDSQKIPG